MTSDRIAKSALFLLFLLTAGLSLTGNGIHASLFPAGEGSNSPAPVVADLDNDGRQEEYLLINHSLIVREGERSLWRSPPDWRVDNFALGDIDNDGTLNLVVTLWKRGSYGPVKPFWQTGEDKGYMNHLFVYRLQDKALRQVWCSSALDRPVVSFMIQDVDGDGRNELAVREGRYRRMFGERYALDRKARILSSVWKWEEWGFRRQ